MYPTMCDKKDATEQYQTPWTENKKGYKGHYQKQRHKEDELNTRWLHFWQDEQQSKGLALTSRPEIYAITNLFLA